jgi:hypothetical protein
MADTRQRRAASDDLLGGDGSSSEDANDESREDRDDAAEGGDAAPNRAGDEDPAELRERLRNQRRVNSQMAKRLKDLESKASTDQSVEERARAAEDERDRIRRELQEERAIRTIMATATRAGAVDVEDVADLMLRRNMIDFDDDGRPRDVADAIEELKRSKPHLFSTRRVPDADAGRGNGRRGEAEQKTDWNSAFRRSAAK